MSLVPLTSSGNSASSAPLLRRLMSLWQLEEERNNGRSTSSGSNNQEGQGEGQRRGREGEEDEDELWVKTSLERIEHFKESQKFSHYISHPINLGEHARNMLVEHKLLGEAVKDAATYVKNHVAGTDPEEFVRQTLGETSRDPKGLRVFGRASKGDSFFKDKEDEEDAEGLFSPNVADFFGKNRKSSSTKAKRGEKSHSKANVEFPEGTLKDFVLYGTEPGRIADRRYQMQNDALDAYLNERNCKQVRDYECGLPNLVDKSKAFVVELTVYPRTERHVEEQSSSSVTEVGSSQGIYTVEVLGSQKLSDLRDAIVCQNDYIYLKEMRYPEDNLDLKEIAKHKFRSAMLLIDNTIYNESRWKDCFDYASQIITWTKRPPLKKPGPFKRGDMSTTKIEELTVQFGYPYLFRHLGDCEHIIVFNNIRILGFEDEYRVKHFPRTTWISKMLPMFCRIDGEFIAKWAVLDHPEFPENPMLICTECLRSFCYNTLGEKRGTFRLFPYRQLACEIPLASESMSPSTKLSHDNHSGHQKRKT